MQPSVGWVRTGIGLAALGYGVVSLYGAILLPEVWALRLQECLTTVILSAMFFVCRKHPVAATAGTLGVILLELASTVMQDGTISCASVIVFPLIVFSAGLLLGGRGAMVAGLASAVLIPLSVYAGGSWGWNLAKFSVARDGYWLLIAELTIFVTTFLTREAVRSYYSAWQEIERSRTRYVELFQSTPDVLIALGEGGVVVDFNQAAQQLFEGVQMQSSKLTDLWGRIGGIGSLDTCWKEGQERGQAELRTRKGKQRLFEVTVRRHSGLGFDSLVMLRDVTERRLLEERLGHAQKLELVGRLAGGVAHDFNNLLTVVAGNATMLKAHEDPRVQQIAQSIIEAQQRGAGLTRQLLAFARKDLFKPTPVDMAAMVFGMRRLLERVLGEQHVLDIELSGDVHVMADLAQMEQVLLNFVCNARDAMPKGGKVLVRLFACTKEEAARQGSTLQVPRQVVLEVRDEGVGMSEEVVARLFEPFFTTKPRGQGTGLGLASAQGVVSRSDGQIVVESMPGKGSVFRVFLPHTAKPAEPKAPSATVQDNATGNRGHVLVVEDEPGVRALALTILRRAGYQVTEAPDAVIGLRLLMDGLKVDMVCSDIMLPGMSGIDLKVALRRTHGHLPVLLMSGYFNMEADSPLTPGEGAQVLRKPFTPEELLAAVARTMRGTN